MFTGSDAGPATIRSTTTWAAKNSVATKFSVRRRLNLRSLPSTATGAGPAVGVLAEALSTPQRITLHAVAATRRSLEYRSLP